DDERRPPGGLGGIDGGRQDGQGLPDAGAGLCDDVVARGECLEEAGLLRAAGVAEVVEDGLERRAHEVWSFQFGTTTGFASGWMMSTRQPRFGPDFQSMKPRLLSSLPSVLADIGVMRYVSH